MQTIEEIRSLISEKVPEGLIVPAHTDKGHFYLHIPSGKLFASVTTQMQGVVSSPNLQIWASKLAVENIVEKLKSNHNLLDDENALELLKTEAVKVHKDTFEEAGDLGTIIHNWLEKYNLAEIRRLEYENQKRM